MTDTTLIATTRQRGLHAVGTAGQPVMRAYDQISRYLAQQLSPAHAALFAEPNTNAARATVDWYTSASGPVTRYLDSDDETRAAATKRLAELREEIEARATELTRSKEGGERFLGQMLKLALEIPGEDFIYLVGSQPVLVCWGNLHDSPQAERGVLGRLVRARMPPPLPRPAPSVAAPAVAAAPMPAAAAPAPPAAVASVPMTAAVFSRGWGWLTGLLWLLFALLLFAVFFVLLSGCGVGPRWLTERNLVNFCPLPLIDNSDNELALADERHRTDILEDRLYQLRLAIAHREVECRRQARAITPVQPEREEPEPERRVEIVEVDPERDPEVVVVVPDEDGVPAVIVEGDVEPGVATDMEDPEAAVAVPTPPAVADDVGPEAPVESVDPQVDPETVLDEPLPDAVPEPEAQEEEQIASAPEDIGIDEEGAADRVPDADVAGPEDTTPPLPEDEEAFDERLDREDGQRGEVNVTLMWNGDADLDLRVQCPNGQQIYFNQPSACGGTLDVDMNAADGGGPMSDEPVENIVWGNAPPGRYVVRIDNYESRSDGENPTPFRLRVANGDETEIIEGSIREDEGEVTYYEFVVP